MSKLDFIKKLYNGKNCYSDHMNKDELGFLHISSGVEPLVSDMLDKHKLVFLTGNPGDGKTFIIKAIEPCIIRNNVFVKTDFNEVTNYADAARNIGLRDLRSQEPCRLPYIPLSTRTIPPLPSAEC